MTIEEEIKRIYWMIEYYEEYVRKCERNQFYDSRECDHIKNITIKRYKQNIEWLKELKSHREAWEKCIKEIKEWYWNADKQAIAKDPCVVDAMVDLFIRTIKECRPKEGDSE
jgi:hypothetical protein